MIRAAFALPVFSCIVSISSFAAERSLDVTKLGVVGDGTTVNTAAFQKAIDTCSAEGGGKLSIPAGRFDIHIKNIRAIESRQIGILISGVPGHSLENLTLENLDLQLVGGGQAGDAKTTLPEQESAYPEVRMFGPVMPAYGIYARHVRKVTFKNVRTTVATPDARPAVVFVDVEGVTPADFLAASATGATLSSP